MNNNESISSNVHVHLMCMYIVSIGIYLLTLNIGRLISKLDSPNIRYIRYIQGRFISGFEHIYIDDEHNGLPGFSGSKSSNQSPDLTDDAG
jgi:hypothetical protein